MLWERPPVDTLNCRNGLLDVHTRELRPHDPAFLSPVQIGVNFDPQATCPAIDQFVRDVFHQDSQHVPFELAGWLMLPNTSIQKAVLLLGEGSNGKSVYLTLLQQFLDFTNVSGLSLHRIESDRFSAARLSGKLANICADLPTAALSGTSMFKSITGGDSIAGEHKFKTGFEFRPYSRLVFSANSAPRSDDSTHGFFRRWLCIPFSRIFDETDPNAVPRAVLDARLSTPGELSGMLNRALDALPQVESGRVRESPSMRAAWSEFRQTTDPLAVWLDEHTVDSPTAWVPKEQIRSMYTRACQDAGRPVLADGRFTGDLKRLKPKVRATQRRIKGKPTYVFEGLGLRSELQEPPGFRPELQGSQGFAF